MLPCGAGSHTPAKLPNTPRSTIAPANEGVDWPCLYANSAEAAAAAAEVQRLAAEGAARCAPLTMASAHAQPFGVQVRPLGG